MSRAWPLPAAAGAVVAMAMLVLLLRSAEVATAQSGSPPAQAAAAAGMHADFALAATRRTSAGVYRGRELVRTLWSNVALPAGRQRADWDGTTDTGEVAPAGRYMIKLLSSDVRYVWEGVVGNTSEKMSGPTKWHPEDIAFGMAIAGDTMYVATGYNEARASTFKAKLANPQAKFNVLPGRFRYTGASTFFVATDGETVFWAANDPARHSRHFVFATRTSDDGETLFAAGNALTVANGAGARYKSAIAVLDDPKATITGLAVQPAGRFLFVARRDLGRIEVIDKKTGALVRSEPAAAPGRLAVDRRGRLWAAVSEAAGPRVVRFDVGDDGRLAAAVRLSASAVVDPLAIAVSPDDRLVLIADGGGSQQVKAFDGETGAALWTHGIKGGYATGTLVRDDKFYFRNLHRITISGGIDWSYLAFEPDGSFWVGDSGNDRSQHFSADRRVIGRLSWVPLFYSAFVDANDPTRVFANMLEFRIDYSKPLAPANGSWTLVRNWSHALPADTNDQYSLLRNVATLRNGRTYAQLRSFSRNRMILVELPPDGPLRFTGIETLLLDDALAADGSLRTTPRPEAGKPMSWSIKELESFDERHNPRWRPSRVVATAPPPKRSDPAPFPNVIAPPWETTAPGAIVSLDTRHPRKEFERDAVGHDGFHLGAFDPASGRWLWRTAPSTHKDYRGEFPDDGAFDIGNSIVAAASRSHVIGPTILWQYFGEGWGGGVAGETNMWTHVHDSGLMIGLFGAVQRTIAFQEDEGQPGMAGNAASNSVVRAPNGGIYVYHNDEGFHGGIHRWRIDGLESIEIQEQAVDWSPTRYRAPVPDPADLLSGLARLGVVADGSGGWRRVPTAEVEVDRHRSWWSVRSGFRSYKRSLSPDLEIAHVLDGSATVQRDLPRLAGVSAGWTLSGMVSWSLENHQESDRPDGGGIYLEVLDDAARVIARLWPKRVRDPDDFRVLGNGATLARTDSVGRFGDVIRQATPFVIRWNGGRLEIGYGGEAPVAVEVQDGEAVAARPHAVRIQCWSTAGSRYRRTIGISRVFFRAGSG